MFSSIAKRTFATTIKNQNSINHVTVIGAGAMGSGIAQVIAQSGIKVTLVDQTEAILQKSHGAINQSLKRVGKSKFKDNKDGIEQMVSKIMGNVSLSTDISKAASATDLVLEAIIEDLTAKRDLFKKLDKIAQPSTIFASNTSGLLVRKIAEVTERRDRFLGLHFFIPVPMMKLLEIITTDELSESTLKSAQEFGKSIGKICVKCKDTPGFIVNRLLIPQVLDAVLMAERGDATVEDIDTAMKLGCGYPMGPFELVDLGGIEVLRSIIESWEKNYPKQTTVQQSKLLDEKVRQGELGKKVGKGFYTYDK